MKTRFVTLALVTVVAAAVASSVDAQTKRPAKGAKPAAAAPAPPPGPPPEISVVGIRVIGGGLGKNREEIPRLQRDAGHRRGAGHHHAGRAGHRRAG